MKKSVAIGDLNTFQSRSALSGILTDLYEKMDAVYTETAPNGTLSDRRGRIAIYDNSGTYTFWINVDGSTTWQQMGNSSKIENSGADTYIEVQDDDETEFYNNSVLTEKIYSSGIIDLPKQSAAYVFLNASDVSVNTGSETKITFDGETYDVQNEFDATTNYRFTATKAGKYAIIAKHKWSTLTAGTLINIYIKVNAGYFKDFRYYYGGSVYPVVSTIVSLAANDYVEIFVEHNDGTTPRSVEKGIRQTDLSIIKLA